MGDPRPDDEGEGLDGLAAVAHERRVVVVGGGIAGLVAALECAKVGLRVTLLEASGRLGGAIRTVEVGGLELDAAVEGWSARSGAVRALATELGLADAITASSDASAWIAGFPGGPAPLPTRTIAGVPENPWDEDVRRIIGWGGAWRAYVDRLRPPLTIGKERSLGRLVRSRMGEAVLERMVAPVSLGIYGIHPDDVDVEAVAPGLSTALTRTGSLGGAVADLLVDRPPGPPLEGVIGGMSRLVSAAEARLVELGVVIRREAPVAALERRADGRWSVRFKASPVSPGKATDAPGKAATDDPGKATDTRGTVPNAPGKVPHPSREVMDAADQVIMAVPAAEVRRLLAEIVPALDAHADETHSVEVVTLVVHAPSLPGPPPASVFPISGTHRAVALVDSTARWPWLAAEVPSAVRILRVTFGSSAAAPATARLDEVAAAALAREESCALLGASLEVAGAVRVRFEAPPPASALGRSGTMVAARDAIRAVPGLAAVGGWLAGPGLAQIVPDAIGEADRVRRAALWARSAG